MQETVPDERRILDLLTAYQQSAALAAAIELDLFTAIGQGEVDAEALAARVSASPRGVRILGDYLVALELLEKRDERYRLTRLAAAYLDNRAPGSIGSVSSFLSSDFLRSSFAAAAAAVRRGGAGEDGSSTAPEHPVWVSFARDMEPLAALEAERVAGALAEQRVGGRRVLDVAAGHGLYGIAVAKRDPQVEVVAVDWPAVLEVAESNARRAGVADRFSTRVGSALEIDLGGPYDLVLLPAFLHHFEPAVCERLLTRLRAVLAPDGCLVTVETLAPDGPVDSADGARFRFVMLVTTSGGDLYTYRELDRMLGRAGFGASRLHPLPGSAQSVLLSPRG